MHYITKENLNIISQIPVFAEYRNFIDTNNLFGLNFVEFCTIRGLIEQAGYDNLSIDAVVERAHNRPFKSTGQRITEQLNIANDLIPSGCGACGGGKIK